MEEIVRALIEKLFPPEQSMLASASVSLLLAGLSAGLAALGTAATLAAKRVGLWSWRRLQASFRPPELVQELLRELARADAVVTGTGILTGNAEVSLGAGRSPTVFVNRADVTDRLGRHLRAIERLARRRICEWQETQGLVREANALACLRADCLASKKNA